MLQKSKTGGIFFYPFLAAGSVKLSVAGIKEFIGEAQAG